MSSPTRRAPTIALNGYVPNGMSLEKALQLRAEKPDDYVQRSMVAMAAAR